jgi:hypothetical protein
MKIQPAIPSAHPIHHAAKIRPVDPKPVIDYAMYIQRGRALRAAAVQAILRRGALLVVAFIKRLVQRGR